MRVVQSTSYINAHVDGGNFTVTYKLFENSTQKLKVTCLLLTLTNSWMNVWQDFSCNMYIRIAMQKVTINYPLIPGCLSPWLIYITVVILVLVVTKADWAEQMLFKALSKLLSDTHQHTQKVTVISNIYIIWVDPVTKN